MLRARWLGAAGEDVVTYHQVLTVRNARVVDIQDCRTRREAERLLTA